MTRVLPVITAALGFVVGMAVAWSLTPEPTVVAGPRGAVPVAGAPAIRGGDGSVGTLATPACDEVVEDVRKELSAARAQVASLEIELYGEPIPWPHDIEPRMTEDAFRRTMDEVLAECWPDAKMTQMDCAEPPCMAVLFDAGDPSDCPAWTRTHGIAAGLSTRPVDCGGEQKRMTILLPPSGKYATVDEMMAASGKEDPAVQENFTRRFMARTRDLHLDAPCPE